MSELPEELLASPPRQVRLNGGGIAVVLLALAALGGGVFLAAWLPGVAAEQRERRARFDREAVAAEAGIVSIGPRRGKRDERIVSYRFEADGRTVAGRQRLSRSAARALHAGDRVPVRYLPSDPTTSYLRGGPSAPPSWAVPLIAAAPFLVPLLIALGLRKQFALAAEGRSTWGTVTESGRAYKGSRRIKYEYRALSGQTLTGSYQSSKPVEPGTHVPILYDRDNPRRSARYPLSLVKIDTGRG